MNSAVDAACDDLSWHWRRLSHAIDTYREVELATECTQSLVRMRLWAEELRLSAAKLQQAIDRVEVTQR